MCAAANTTQLIPNEAVDAMAPKKKATRPAQSQVADSYEHKTADSPMRPDVGTQAQFKKRKPPKSYRYDTSLDPALSWDEASGSRGLGEWLLARISDAARLPAPHRFPEPQKLTGADGKTLATVRGLEDAVEQLKAIERPFLNWAGKAERLSFDVPTLPLFIHERLSTKAILQTLKGHKREGVDLQFDLFGDPRHSIVEQSLRAYEHRDRWVNRMILGDSLAVMNSLVEYEGMRGQVQMIYMDPPYGVKFGSNFQPFVRKRDVTHNDDEDMTREPEMVQAYRDTWELGLHSYLTYLRDRLLLARELLTPSGSIFVQISDENLHHVRELMAEVFGPENFIVCFLVKKTGSQKANLVEAVNDYLIWFAKDISRVKDAFSKLYERTPLEQQVSEGFNYVELPSGEDIPISDLKNETGADIDYSREPRRIFEDFPGAKIFAPNPLTSGGFRKNQSRIFRYKGREFDPGIAQGNCWKHTVVSDDGSVPGMDRLAAAGRLFAGKRQLRFRRYVEDFGYKEITNWWDGLGGASEPMYVVQTNVEIIRRCMLMTTKPGDLVLDPTCGSGTCAYVAEHWGRRWITIDTSRVPLALARQRLLTATFPWYDLVDGTLGPAGGFVYQYKQNRKGEHVGGIVPHITSSTVANNDIADEEILVDRPEEDSKTTRVSGPFCVEATIPTAADLEGMNANPEAENVQAAHEETPESFTDRMLEILRRSPLLHLPGNRTVELTNIRKPAKSLSLQAEALVGATAEGQDATIVDAAQEALEQSGELLGGLTKRPVAFIFGPENGAVSERLVYEAAREAHAKSYTHLYVIGFAIHPNARQLVENAEQVIGIRSTYVQMTPDVLMGDLLKNMRSSQIFSVCGLPEVELRLRPDGKYEVELMGLDVFDPETMEAGHEKGENVPAWFLDTDYNGLCFHVCQAFFPRTSAWEGLKKALRADFETTVWDHLAGTVSAPFDVGGYREVAVKVVDDRGNELLTVKNLEVNRK
jgi:adenine-specific DNA-methyltransferase